MRVLAYPIAIIIAVVRARIVALGQIDDGSRRGRMASGTMSRGQIQVHNNIRIVVISSIRGVSLRSAIAGLHCCWLRRRSGG